MSKRERMSKPVRFDYAQLTAILVALRHWQNTGDPEDPQWEDHFEGTRPLSDSEIDELCEFINCG